MKSRIGVGVVGAGSFAESHFSAYSRIPGAEVVWVCDRDLAAAESAADRWGIKAVTASLEDVLADDSVDLVDLVTPVGLHVEQGVAALEAGRSVLCEKPMAADLAGAERLAAAEAESTGSMMVKFHQRFDPVHIRVRDLLATRTFGAGVVAHIEILGDHLAALRSRDHWRGDRKLAGGGCLLESGAHLFDLAHFWFGPAARVTATGHQLLADNPAKGEDTATAVVEFVSGAVLTLTGFWGAPRWQWRKQIFTADQTMLSIETGETNVLHRTGRDGAEILHEQPRWFQGSIDASIAHIVDCVATGRAPAVSSNDALMSMRTVEAAYRSMHEGRTVELA